MTPFPYDLSIVIVNYNGWNLLVSCLDSIQQTANDLRYEIWVVDNGSIDGSVMRLKDRFPNIKCIENNDNLGFARANNQALSRCAGRYVLLLNNDTIAHPTAFQMMIQALENHPQFAAVGPQLINADGTLQPSCMHFRSRLGIVFNYIRAKCGGSPKFIPQTNLAIVEVDAVTGACMLIRRNALEQVGLLDDGYFMYAEELDWCYRASRLMWGIGYVPAAKVTHLGGQTAQRESGRFYVERRISRVRFTLKHFGYFSAWRNAFFIRANIWAHWLVSPSQRDYYARISLDFDSRVNALFHHFKT